MITAVFDLDGTIANSIQDLACAVNHGLKILGYPEHDIETYKKFVGNGAKTLCFRALPDDKKSDADKLHGIFREYYKIHYLDNTKAYDGIKEAVELLAENGVTLAVATNKPQDVAREIVGKLLPSVSFYKILGGCEERPKKPDPAIIREILEGLPDENTVYMIGDSNVDMQTAKNASVTSIGCLWGFRTRDELVSEGADFTADSPADIAGIVLR